MLVKRNYLAPLGLLFATAVFAQEKPARRLESVTWNPAEHKLTWTVSTGKSSTDGKFQPKDTFQYEIDMDAAVMSTSGEDRRFSKEEAVRVHALMDMVAKYAAESTIWWDAGEGEPLSGKDKSVIKQEDRRRLHRDLPQMQRPPQSRPKLPPGVRVIKLASNQPVSQDN
jgi:hypothetical protein